MVDIRIWAPYAKKVEVELADGRRELTSDGHGYWETALEHGTRYYVRLNDGDRVPDPRAMRQPEGAHGPSEVVDPSTLLFSLPDYDSGPLEGKVFYELHIGTFTEEGTFRSAIERLDHLKNLGVDAVELLPVSPIPGERNWGYDGVQIYAVNEAYGSPEDLAALVDAIHERGMAAVIDVVYNHFGPDGNYLAQFGPYFTDKHHTPWGQAVNVDDTDSENVRSYIIDNALQWLRDYRFDALRLDAIDYINDDSDEHVIAELSDAVHRLGQELGRTLTVTAESDRNDPLTISPTSLGGKGADMQWTDDIHHALHVWLTGEKNGYYMGYEAGADLETALCKGFVRTGEYNEFRGQNWGHPLPDSISGHQLIAFDENHDQVGNRLRSDRPSEKLSLGQLAVSRAIILLSPFTPMLFMGEEWASTTPFPFFTDFGDDIGQHIRDGRLNEFKNWNLDSIYEDMDVSMPDPQDRATFESAKLDWDSLGHEAPSRFLEFVRELIRLRRSDSDIASGDRSQTEVKINGSGGWMRRGKTLIVFSIDDQAATVSAPVDDRSLVLAWDDVDNTPHSVNFSGAGVAVFR